jgi:hypothetical protein
MHRRHVCLAALALATMIAVGALPGREKPRPLLLDWAVRMFPEAPPAAVLVEMGLKDREPTNWSCRFSLTKARLLRREGYRFGPGDQTRGANAWVATTHRPPRLPPRRPDLRRMEPVATVGVVFHISDILPGAELRLEPYRPDLQPATIPLDDVLAGRTQAIWDGAAVVRRVSGTVALSGGQTEDDFPAAAYGPDGTLWLAYVTYMVRDEARRVEATPLPSQPAEFKALDRPGFSDQLVVRYYRDKRWSAPLEVTGYREDLLGCAVAAEADGTVWVVYGANRGGTPGLYARALQADRPGGRPRPGPERKLSGAGRREFNPVACTAQDGTVHLAWQSGADKLVVRHGQFRKGELSVAGESFGQDAQGNAWTPAVSAGPDGVSVAYDCFRDGDYDVAVGTEFVARSPRFEARPSACWDEKGRLWVAYEEGPEHWGKDYGALSPRTGNPLYSRRAIRVVCLQDGKLFRPTAELPAAASSPPRLTPTQAGERDPEDRAWPHYEAVRRQSSPRLGLDGRGRLWLTYREKFGDRYATVSGSYWLNYARRLDGDHWTEPIEVLHSDGPLDNRPVLLPHMSGGLLVLHSGDDRYTAPLPDELRSRVYASHVNLPGDPIEPKLVPAEAGEKESGAADKERATVRRCREFRTGGSGKDYRLLRGEFHRHTDISWDGGSDGSLEDMFRYALDAAALDWIGNGDHDNGHGREYTWWLTQKFTDAYHLPGSFTTMFSYERSVAWPQGHRNCVFPRRGILTLPRLGQPDKDKQVGGVHADDTKMLYRYLHELGGICAVHTSATGMGTDWRDNDPDVEPVVELYQGDRMSYEKEGAPRTGNDPKSGKPPPNLGGWHPRGYVNRALGKGYRLGFVASSDHWSTHISYAVVLAERNDRESVLEALRRRHCYAATDDIVLDVRSGGYVMGDLFTTSGAPALEIHAIGTGPLEVVDVLRDSEVVKTFHPDGAEFKQSWTDPRPAAGTHYYYVRVRQKDGQLAWGSPLWIESGK